MILYMYMHVYIYIYIYIYMYIYALSLYMYMYTCSHLSFKNMYILGLVFGVIGGFITPAFSFILS